MSSARVVFVEMEGSSEVLSQVIAQFVERAKTPNLVRQGPDSHQVAAPVVPAPALPAPKEEAPPRRHNPRRASIPTRKGRKAESRSASEPEANSADGPTGQKLRAILAKGPQASGDLIRLSGLTAPSVYSWLSLMRRQGVVETRADEVDGYTKKNYLVG